MFDFLPKEDVIETYLIPWGIKLSYALLILIIGLIVAKILVSVLRKILVKARADEILVNFVASIVKAVLLLFVFVATLDQLGVNTTSFVAVLGAAGLAIGLALQGSLQNFAAGIMLVVFRPFKNGDFVEAGGTSGIVEHITIFSTMMRTPDNRSVIIPNGAIYSGTITNYSARATRRVDLVFGIGYEDDIKRAKEVIWQILKQDERILAEPEATVAIGELADSSVNFVVRPWVKSGDYWPVTFDLNERIKLAFDAEGISIPFPQMDLHLNRPAE